MRKTIFGAILISLTFSVLCIRGAFAQNYDSVYTNLDLDVDCTVTKADDFGATFACPGYKGIPVMVAETDLRMFVSYGLDSLHEKAAGQTFAPFNSIGKVLEWRLANRANGWTPFATILRFYTDDGMGAKQQYLVVTKIEQGATCHVARINASRVKNANQVAREMADNLAKDFDCANAPLLKE